MHNAVAKRKEGYLDQEWVHLDLAAMFGHRAVVARLRECVREHHHSTGIIIHGPEGVGKRTLARVYARALLCESPTLDGEACKVCSNCVSFENSRPLGYTELDTKVWGDEDTARELVARLKAPSVAKRHVVIIVNADAYAAAAFDALLKTMEDSKDGVTFILLASELTKVRLAGRSRCHFARLRAPPVEETRKRLDIMLASAGASVDPKVLDVLVAHTRGRVTEMQKVVEAVAGLPCATMTAVRSALGQDWFGGAAEFWRAALAEGPPLQSMASLKTGVTSDTLPRLQAILLRLQPGSEASAQAIQDFEAGLLHQDQGLHELAELLRKQAGARGQTPIAAWRRLAERWASDDYVDAEGLQAAGMVARELLLR